MKRTTQFLTVVPLVVTIFSCDVNRVHRTNHEPEKVVAEKNRLPDEPADHEVFNSIDLNAIHAELSAAVTKKSADSISVYEGIIKKLGPIVLNNNYLQNPTYSAAARARSMLTYYNTALAQLVEAKGVEVMADELEKFSKAVHTGCDVNLNGCRNMGFFKKDNQSARVLIGYVKILDLKIEKTQKNDDFKALAKNYYDFLALAMELKNSTRDTEIEFLYLKRAREYAILFQSSSDQEQNSDLFKRHGAIFENIVNGFKPDVKDQKFKEFVAKFQPWIYSRLTKDPFPFGTRKMFSFAATHFLYEDASRKALSKEMRDAIELSQAKEDRLGPTFTQMIENIRSNAAIAFIFKSLNVDPDEIKKADFFDEYFFMIDRLFREHLDLQEVGEVWRGSNKDFEKLIARLEYYMKVQVLDKIIKTNKYMSDIISQKGMGSETLIRQTLEKSKLIGDEWKVMLNRFEGRLGIFLGTELRNSTQSEAALKRANKMIDSVRRNIKYLSVYPNMLLLMYFAQDLDATLTVDGFFGQIEIKTKDLIANLFSGFVSPWFFFGNDTYPLNKFELLYAYYFSLTTGTFETFGQRLDDKGQPSVDRKMFFQKVVRQYLTPDRLKLEEAIKKYKSSRREGDYLNLIQICEKVKSGNLDFPLTVNMNDFQFYALLGNASAGPWLNLKRVYGPESDIGPTNVIAQIIRTNSGQGNYSGSAEGVEGKVNLLSAMVDVLTKNMKDLNYAEKDIQEIQSTAKKEIEEVLKLTDEYYSQVMAQHREASTCFYDVLKLDRKRVFELIQLERKHLETVYDFMVSIQGKTVSEIDTLVTNNKKELGFEDKLDRVTAQVYNYNVLNVNLRMKNWSAQMKPSVEIILPEELMETAAAKTYKTINILDSKKEIIPKETFVKTGLSYYRSGQNSIFYWLANLNKFDSIQQKAKAMIELYLYQHLRGLPADRGITVEELTQEALSALDYIDIKPEEEELLKLLGEESIVGIDSLRKFIFTDSMQKLGVLDKIYENIADLSGPFQEGITMSLTMNNMGYFLFPPDKDVEKMVIDRYRPWLQSKEKMVRDFEQKVDSLESRISAQQQHVKTIVYRIADGEKQTYSVAANEQSQKVGLISQLKRADIEAKFYDFHTRKTGGYFKLTDTAQTNEKSAIQNVAPTAAAAAAAPAAPAQQSVKPATPSQQPAVAKPAVTPQSQSQNPAQTQSQVRTAPPPPSQTPAQVRPAAPPAPSQTTRPAVTAPHAGKVAPPPGTPPEKPAAPRPPVAQAAPKPIPPAVPHPLPHALIGDDE